MLNPNSLARIVSEISAFIQTDRLLYFMGSEKLSSVCYILSDESIVVFYPFTLRVTEIQGRTLSRVPRLSDTLYSSKGTKGKWRCSKARLKCVT